MRDPQGVAASSLRRNTDPTAGTSTVHATAVALLDAAWPLVERQGITLLGVSVLPSVAWRVNDRLSLGASLNVMHGTFETKVAVNNIVGPDGHELVFVPRLDALDDTRQAMTIATQWVKPGSSLLLQAAETSGGVLPRGVGLAGLVWQTGEPLWVPQLRNDPRLAQAVWREKLLDLARA